MHLNRCIQIWVDKYNHPPFSRHISLWIFSKTDSKSAKLVVTQRTVFVWVDISMYLIYRPLSVFLTLRVRGQDHPSGPFHLHGIPEIRAWTTNYIHGFKWDVIIHPCPLVNGGLTKPLLEFGNGWVIISYSFRYVITYPWRSPQVDLANPC